MLLSKYCQYFIALSCPPEYLLYHSAQSEVCIMAMQFFCFLLLLLIFFWHSLPPLSFFRAERVNVRKEALFSMLSWEAKWWFLYLFPVHEKWNKALQKWKQGRDGQTDRQWNLKKLLHLGMHTKNTSWNSFDSFLELH